MSSAFTISATPDFLPISANTASGTFAGSADFNGSDYNASRGLLVVNGTNFRGVKRVYFAENGKGDPLTNWMASNNATAAANGENRYFGANGGYTGFAIDANALPSGVTINAAGTQMSFTKAAINDINATWLVDGNGPSNRSILFLGAADENASTPWIKPTK
jgi:hypothetical protein